MRRGLAAGSFQFPGILHSYPNVTHQVVVLTTMGILCRGGGGGGYEGELIGW